MVRKEGSEGVLSDPPLSFGEAGLMSLGRFPGSGFRLLAAPSHRFVIRIFVYPLFVYGVQPVTI